MSKKNTSSLKGKAIGWTVGLAFLNVFNTIVVDGSSQDYATGSEDSINYKITSPHTVTASYQDNSFTVYNFFTKSALSGTTKQVGWGAAGTGTSTEFSKLEEQEPIQTALRVGCAISDDVTSRWRNPFQLVAYGDPVGKEKDKAAAFTASYCPKSTL